MNFTPAALKNFSPGKLSRRERLLFYGILFILTLFFLDRFVIRRAAEMLKRINADINTQELVYRNSLTLANNREQIELLFESYKQYLQPEKGSEEDSLAGIFSYLESLARENNMTLVDIKPKKGDVTAEDEHLSLYPIEVEVETGLDPLLNFFYQLSQGVPILDVKKVTLKVKEGSLEAKIELEAVIFK